MDMNCVKSGQSARHGYWPFASPYAMCIGRLQWPSRYKICIHRFISSHINNCPLNHTSFILTSTSTFTFYQCCPLSLPRSSFSSPSHHSPLLALLVSPPRLLSRLARRLTSFSRYDEQPLLRPVHKIHPNQILPHRRPKAMSRTGVTNTPSSGPV